MFREIVFLGQLRKLSFSLFCKNFHIATVDQKETSQRLDFYPPTHQKRHNDVSRGNMNMDGIPKANVWNSYEFWFVKVDKNE